MPRAHRSPLALLTSLVLVSVVGAGCGGSTNATTTTTTSSAAPTAASGDRVSISDYAFAPATSSVRAGSTLTFSNRDQTEHTATVTGSADLDTGTIKAGGAGSIRFPKAGRFTYICVFHPYMKGTVVVTTP